MENERFKQAQQGYSMDRARYAGDQANTFANVATEGGQTGWRNRAADQRADYLNEVGGAQTGEANRLGNLRLSRLIGPSSRIIWSGKGLAAGQRWRLILRGSLKSIQAVMLITSCFLTLQRRMIS